MPTVKGESIRLLVFADLYSADLYHRRTQSPLTVAKLWPLLIVIFLKMTLQEFHIIKREILPTIAVPVACCGYVVEINGLMVLNGNYKNAGLVVNFRYGLGSLIH